MTGEYEWRQSGKDACSHAFQAEGGYVKQSTLISVVPTSSEVDATEEFFGPYEAFVSSCGQVVPVAMLMPGSAGPSCTACQLITDSVPAGRPRSAPRTVSARRDAVLAAAGEPGQ